MKSFTQIQRTAWSLTALLLLMVSNTFAKDVIPLMIYGVSIGEEKAVVVKFHEKDGKPILRNC